MNADLGIVGLGTMGANLALNLVEHGIVVAGTNRSADRIDIVARQARALGTFVPALSIVELVAALTPPRRILLMVPAGAPVDAVLAELRPLLQSGDIVIDGGNSLYRDTERRLDALSPAGIRFIGMGVSGGEDGARHGPSLMPGGDAGAYRELEPLWTAIAARTESGPCVTHVGARGAGHFVKMIHNGIEYADMQLIAEAYDFLRHGIGLEPTAIAALFEEWNRGELRSFLIEITAKIVDAPDDRAAHGVLLDAILDEAGQKGTGRWTTEAALALGIPVPALTAAVDARLLSARRAMRDAARAVHGGGIVRHADASLVPAVRAALYAAKIGAYAQGFDLLRTAGTEFEYGLRLGELARIWKGGCIIRAAFLDDVRRAYETAPELPSLLVDERLAAAVAERLADWRRIVQEAVAIGIPVPGFAASLAYFDSLRREILPANLIQAQRDFFGAHTYQRRDRPGAFHSEWPA
jgi:6-phosphogluconate dehydrogenase